MRVFDPQANRWEEAPSPLALPLNERDSGALDSGELGLLRQESGSRFIVSKPGLSSPILLVGLDAAGFFEGYVVPAVSAVLPGAEFSWLDSHERPFEPRDRGDGPPLDDGQGPRGMAMTRFSPLRALLGGKNVAVARFMVPVPMELTPVVSAGGGGGRPDSAPPARPEQKMFLVPIGSMGGPMDERIRFLSVSLSLSSATGSIERRLSFNWLLGNILLLGVGFAFVQAVVQRRRLGLLRQREREFVASVTHELRTPLTVIGSAADNLRHGLVVGQRVIEYGDLIAGQSARLGSMIEEVLLYSEVEGKKTNKRALSPTGPEQIGAELRGPLEELVRGSGSKLEWNLEALPPSFLGDQAGITLVLSNLVANAAFHAYAKGSGGAVRVLGKPHGPGSVAILIEDDGRGIPRSEADLVFEPFYRDEAARANRDKGTGTRALPRAAQGASHGRRREARESLSPR